MTSKTMKTTSDTLSWLDKLKPEYEAKYPREYVSYDTIVQELILEHNRNNDPENIMEKKRKHDEDYIAQAEYRRIVDELFLERKRLQELELKSEQVKKELTDKLRKLQEDFNLKSEKYQNNIFSLNNKLEIKKNDLSILNQKKNELVEKNMNLEIEVTNLRKKFVKCDSEYNELRKFVDEECITKKMLETIFYIAWFLFRHKNGLYTVRDLYFKIQSPLLSEDLNEALYLTRYKIFPVRCFRQNDIEYYHFDKKYLRH